MEWGGSGWGGKECVRSGGWCCGHDGVRLLLRLLLLMLLSALLLLVVELLLLHHVVLLSLLLLLELKGPAQLLVRGHVERGHGVELRQRADRSFVQPKGRLGKAHPKRV